MRIIGLDIHRAFAEAVAWDDGKLKRLSRFHLVNQRIGFLRFSTCADSQGEWHGGKVFGCGQP
jgi:hypothetical protein